MKRRILIIEDHDDLSTELSARLVEEGHTVTCVSDHEGAGKVGNLTSFDLIVIDLGDVEFVPEKRLKGECVNLTEAKNEGDSQIRAFKVCGANYRRENFDDEELRKLIAEILEHKAEYVDRNEIIKQLHEKIEFEVPSSIALNETIVDYLIARVEKIGVTSEEQSNLRVALSEAFINAIKHGNKFDAGKAVHVSADISPREARFTIEDQGSGFDIATIPDPRDAKNLFKGSGRGVLIIQHIMDEVSYSERGNRLTMIKRSDNEKSTKSS